jgi:hypothetical protein
MKPRWNEMGSLLVSKVDVALIAALALGAVLIENGHRVAIVAPEPFERAAQPPAAACPDNDKVPYSAECLKFMKGATELGMRWRIKAEPLTVPQTNRLVPPERPLTSASACPMNDSVPYSSRCIAFLNGPDPAAGPH